jgi:hypothetical protein
MKRAHLVSAAGVLLLLLAGVSTGLLSSPKAAEADFPAAELSTNLLFECQPNAAVRVYLQWTSSSQGPQWVDLSLSNNDFAPGTFLSSGPLPSDQASLVWDGLQPGTWHFVRVNTLTPAGWFASNPMVFFTPSDCASATQASVYPPPIPIGCLNLAPAAQLGFAACVTTAKDDFGSYQVSETVFYCFAINQPMNVRVVTTKPDGSQLLVFNGFFEGAGACIGPYQANVPLGLRTVDLFGGPDFQLLSETHFYVD